MCYKSKREIFVKQKRQRQRETIFKKHRAAYARQVGSQFERLPQQKLKHNQKFCLSNELLDMDISKTKLNGLVSSQPIQNILSQAPRWLESQSQTECADQAIKNYQQQVIHQLIIVVEACISQDVFMLKSTNCLVQLTGLPKKFLISVHLDEGALAKRVIPYCLQILQKTSDMQIAINCVYIVGNLQESICEIQTAASVQKLRVKVLERIEFICIEYPNYDRCIQTILWFIRSCLLIPKPTRHLQSIEQDVGNFQFCCVHMLRRIVVTICSKFTDKVMFNIENTKTIEYYHCSLGSVFSIFSIMISDSQLLDNSVKGSGNHEIGRVLETIDECIVTYVATFLDSLDSAVCQRAVKFIFQTIGELIIRLRSMSKLEELPKSIIQLCIYASEGRIKCAQGMQATRKLLDLPLQFAAYKLLGDIIRNILINAKIIFGHEAVVRDRKYRISCLQMFEQIEDQLSRNALFSAIKKITTNDIFQTQKTKQVMVNSYQGEEGYLLYEVVLPVLNVIPLAMIDEDSQNRVLGLRIIYKLTANWDLKQELVRNMVEKLGIATLVLSMSEDKEEIVYNNSLNLIEELGLDELQNL